MVAVIVNYFHANCLYTIAFNNQEDKFYNSIVYKKKSSFDHWFPSLVAAQILVHHDALFSECPMNP